MSLAEELTYPHIDIAEMDPSTIPIEAQPLTDVRIDSLVLSDSPRLDAEDPDHVRMLAEAGDCLPPITVHRPTLRVIDGAHRVRAALLNGRTEIAARLLDCDPADAFVLSVKANVTHGLPLSRADRAAAATRIILTHPQWSDCAIAAATGISDKTVSRIRAQTPAGGSAQSSTRIGRDGRVRPVDSAERRRHAAAIFLEHPEAGLREVARATGLSPATVRDVRQRISRGADPVPGRYRTTQDEKPAESAPAAAAPTRQRPSAPPGVGRGAVAVDRQELLAKLSEDPSLRHSEAGRTALRWLHHYSVDGDSIENLGRGLPRHWAPKVADLARSCAATWSELAAQLQEQSE
ncbi:ParB N-terminal domain-containing protein [Streptomyces sp. B-S-A8]|uniref:ParB N-terminal domain-containing protein n=1 Tax=Streptomyces solicavernae TaxID=3043614 RepID=A0ABT6RZK0_9ACTN|nr:ParB N-terminal domain-containing protein [Streptomyces sp. B-S-A8]MDI3389867.1 ParB N-terminal domain-containing protein [Streptomyces sp. B-S-A8]